MYRYSMSVGRPIMKHVALVVLCLSLPNFAREMLERTFSLSLIRIQESFSILQKTVLD